MLIVTLDLQLECPGSMDRRIVQAVTVGACSGCTFACSGPLLPGAERRY